MGYWVIGRIPKSLRLVTAERHIWHFHLYSDYFGHVTQMILEKTSDFVCIVCDKRHNAKSDLISCFRNHRDSTVNYFLDHILPKISKKEVGNSW